MGRMQQHAAQEPARPAHAASEPPVTIGYGDHPAQFLEVYRPAGVPGPHPVVALIHGGFWRLPWGLELMRPLALDLVSRGYAAVNIEYRRLGEAGGGWPGSCQDVTEAVLALATADVGAGAAAGLDLARGIGLVGHSAGGHLALCAASRLMNGEEAGADNPVAIRIVVSQAGVVDLRAAVRDRLDEENGKPPAALEFMGADPEAPAATAAYALASPMELLPLGPRVRQVVLHGEADNRVPYRQGVDYARAAQQAGDDVRFLPFTGMGHFELIDPAHESWQASVRELEILRRPER
jgi:acetyl esterase/lipase